MSDLSATQCGCQERNNGGNNWIWIILIIFFLCNCCDNSCDNTCGCGFNFLRGGDNNCCEWIIILLILSSCCGCGSLF